VSDVPSTEEAWEHREEKKNTLYASHKDKKILRFNHPIHRRWQCHSRRRTFPGCSPCSVFKGVAEEDIEVVAPVGEVDPSVCVCVCVYYCRT
jgi:hypothetical protein